MSGLATALARRRSPECSPSPTRGRSRTRATSFANVGAAARRMASSGGFGSWIRASVPRSRARHRCPPVPHCVLAAERNDDDNNRVSTDRCAVTGRPRESPGNQATPADHAGTGTAEDRKRAAARGPGAGASPGRVPGPGDPAATCSTHGSRRHCARQRPGWAGGGGRLTCRRRLCCRAAGAWPQPR
jgi:hypothetical protein